MDTENSKKTLSAEEAEQLNVLFASAESQSVDEVEATMTKVAQENPQLVGVIFKAISGKATDLLDKDERMAERAKHHRQLGRLFTNIDPKVLDEFIGSEEYEMYLKDYDYAKVDIDKDDRALAELMFVKLATRKNKKAGLYSLLYAMRDDGKEAKKRVKRLELYSDRDMEKERRVSTDGHRAPSPKSSRMLDILHSNPDKLHELQDLENLLLRNAYLLFNSHADRDTKIARIYSYALYRIFSDVKLNELGFDDGYKKYVQNMNLYLERGESTVATLSFSNNKFTWLIDRKNTPLDETFTDRLKAEVKQLMKELLPAINQSFGHETRGWGLDNSDLYEYFGLRRTEAGNYETVVDYEDADEANLVSGMYYNQAMDAKRRKRKKSLKVVTRNDLLITPPYYRDNHYRHDVDFGANAEIFIEQSSKLEDNLQRVVANLAFVQQRYDQCRDLDLRYEYETKVLNSEQWKKVVELKKELLEKKAALEALEGKFFKKRARRRLEEEIEAKEKEDMEAQKELQDYIMDDLTFSDTRLEQGFIFDLIANFIELLRKETTDHEKVLQELNAECRHPQLITAVEDVRKVAQEHKRFLGEIMYSKFTDDEGKVIARLLKNMRIPDKQEMEIPVEQLEYFENVLENLKK